MWLESTPLGTIKVRDAEDDEKTQVQGRQYTQHFLIKKKKIVIFENTQNSEGKKKSPQNKKLRAEPKRREAKQNTSSLHLSDKKAHKKHIWCTDTKEC